MADAKKAETAYQEEMTKQAQEMFAIEIQTLQAEAEADLLRLQNSINTYKNQLADADYDRFNALYDRYLNELDELIGMQRQLVNNKNQLARLEANVISTEAYNQYYIKNQERNIAAYEAQIALLKDPAYAALDREEAYAKYMVAYKEASLAQTAFNASEAPAKLIAANELVKEKNLAMDEIKKNVNKISYVLSYDIERSIEVIMHGDQGFYNYWSDYHYYDLYKNIRIDETAKLNETRYYADNVEYYAGQLGKADDAKDKATAYGQLAAANDELKTAKAMPETTDAEKDAKKIAIADAEYAIAQAADNLANWQKWYDDAVKAQTEFTEALAALDIEAANKLAEEFEVAIEANEAAWEEWEEARERVQEKWNVSDALNDIWQNASSDIEQQIANLESNIASCKAKIEDYKVNSAEQTLANAKEDIANLEAKIAVQEKVVADAKAAVDAYLVTEEAGGEAEETPTE